MKIVDIEQGSPEWYKWRIGKGTASNAAAIIGKDPHKTPYQVFCEMTLRTPGFEGNKFTEAGKIMEPKARSIYEIRHNFVEMKPVCIEHETYPELAASLDGLRMPDFRVSAEFKYPSEKSHNIAREGNVPEHYLIQTQHQMMCGREIEQTDYCSFREDELLEVIVKPDPIMIAGLEKSWLAFLELVRSDVAPPLTEDDVKIIENNPAVAALCEEIRKKKAEKETKELKQMLERLKGEAVSLGGHAKIKCNGVQISTVLRKGVFSFHKLTISENA